MSALYPENPDPQCACFDPRAHRAAGQDDDAKNLLLSFPRRTGRIPRLWRSARAWDIVSGDWTRQPEGPVRLRGDRDPRPGESMALIGRQCGHELAIRVRFRFLSDTCKPPEGGAIVFFLVQNEENHLAFHYCLGKNQIQLYKRIHGVWTMLGAQSFQFELSREYEVGIQTGGGVHECRMRDVSILRVCDRELLLGSVGIGGKFCDIEFIQLQVLPL
jgi:hypothetical protein